MSDPTDQLRDRIAAALTREDVNWGYHCGFETTTDSDMTAAYVNAVLAEVQPELDRLADQNTLLHAETLAQGNALLRARAAHASTIVEVKRQARRADVAESALLDSMAWAHRTIYHSAGQPCPAPTTCPDAAQEVTE